MVAGLFGEVPQVLRAVVGGAVVDGVVPHALGAANGVAPGVDWLARCLGLVVKYEVQEEVPHALAVKCMAELGDPAHLT